MNHPHFMQRCIDLAKHGIPWALPNPLVGAVLVYENRIIGEGYHARYGEGHAEVNCLASVPATEQHLIAKATLYVSLEPCSHTGKTPPCVNLILRHQIPHVVVASLDPSAKVNGRGIATLREAGVHVELGVLEHEARALNPGFFTYHEKHRPHITLKWAESADGFLGRRGERTALSHANTQYIVHDWRRQHQAIWVGLQTARTDQPLLNNRLWPGPSPRRLTYDRALQQASDADYFNDGLPALIFNHHVSGILQNKEFVAIPTTNPLEGIIDWLYQQQYQSVLVEGGANLINQLIERQLFDTLYRIKTPIVLGDGVPAPRLPNSIVCINSQASENDLIEHYQIN